MRAQPETLAKRAVHEYRRRDTLAYASLRLYLSNKSALRDRWARGIASDLVLDQGQPIYNRILYFKKTGEKDSCEFRDLFIPGPNEILAETSLLGECAKYPSVFQPPSGVYSYMLSSGAASNGVYKYYFYGFLDRHSEIARACRKKADSVVTYTDITKFYPSISIELARTVWSAACNDSDFPNGGRELGMKLLENYGRSTSRSGSGLPIGPMFSHLIGNLVLRDIDLKMAEMAPGRYFRYVDDFVIVAPKEEADKLEFRLKSMLNSKGLDLHPDKRFQVPAGRWLDVADFFDDEESPVSWKTFVGQLKQLMLFRPDSRLEMEKGLREAEIRIRPLDYSTVRQERDYLSRARYLAENVWFRIRMHNLSPNRIVQSGVLLRSRYMGELFEAIQYFRSSDTFGRKMSTTRVRYLLSRLAYLATPDQLLTIADLVADIEEVRIYAAILRALANRDVSDLLKFGPVAARSVARSLKMDSNPVRCSVTNFTEEAIQAYAILLLYGVPLEVAGELPESPITTFCRGGHDISALFDSSELYYRELACIHGLDEPEVLKRTLETAFDRDEELAFEIMDILDISYWL